MKTRFVSTMALGLTLIAGGAGAFTVDTLLGSKDLSSSGDSDELAALVDILNLTADPDYTVDDFTLTNGTESVFYYDATLGNFYIDIDPDVSDYFILKFGTGSTPAVSHYFFDNIPELTKLVWTNIQVSSLLDGFLSELPADATGIYEIEIGDDVRLSHYNLVSSSSSSSSNGGGGGSSSNGIPEPGVLSLFGVGILGGLFAYRRRRQLAA